MNQPVRLHFSELRVPLKATFRHASAARTHGESLWVEAARGPHRGYGEGCPRAYVTGETRASCRQWLGTWQEAIQTGCTCHGQSETPHFGQLKSPHPLTTEVESAGENRS